MDRIRPTLCGAVVAVVLLTFGVSPGVAADSPPDTELKFTLIVTRHGILSPLAAQTTALDPYAAEAWPKWDVPPSDLTPLTLDNGPAVAPIFVPGASEPCAGFGAPLTAFSAMVRRLINSESVVASLN